MVFASGGVHTRRVTTHVRTQSKRELKEQNIKTRGTETEAETEAETETETATERQN